MLLFISLPPSVCSQLVLSKSDVAKLEKEKVVLEEKERGLLEQIQRLNKVDVQQGSDIHALV